MEGCGTREAIWVVVSGGFQQLNPGGVVEIETVCIEAEPEWGSWRKAAEACLLPLLVACGATITHFTGEYFGLCELLTWFFPGCLGVDCEAKPSA